MHRYLIECEDDLKSAIGNAIIADDLTLGCVVRGGLEAPNKYPYIAVIHCDEEYDQLELAFVTLSDFQ